MRKFTPKPIEVVERQCREQGLSFMRMRSPSGIYIGIVYIEGGGANVKYRPSTGEFFGQTPDGTIFHSKKPVKSLWFEQLKAFFWNVSNQSANEGKVMSFSKNELYELS